MGVLTHPIYDLKMKQKKHVLLLGPELKHPTKQLF